MSEEKKPIKPNNLEKNEFESEYLRTKNIKENKFENVQFGKQNKGNKKFIIFYIVFVVILICATILAIYFTIQNMEKQEEIKQEENPITNVNEVVTETPKKEAEDKKYAITSYQETYDENAIKIIQYYDANGTVTTNREDLSPSDEWINFIQIDGLKNKSIQNNINERLKNAAYSLYKSNMGVSTYVFANFCNILSVEISGFDNNITLNIDLATGNDIKLEDLFLSSAPINSYLANALYKTLAWEDSNTNSEDEYDLDMSKVDTSEYEEKFLMLINNYNKQKDKLKYTISSNKISIYNLLTPNILDVEWLNNVSIEIDLTECIEEVAMYKKFLTAENIYENNSIGQKDIIVFTDAYTDYFTVLNYGKIQDNIFMEEIAWTFNEEKDLKVPMDYIKKLSNLQKASLKSKTSSSNGVFFQREYNIYKNEENEFYGITVSSYQAKCSISYFENDAFLDFIKLKSQPVAEATLLSFNEYVQKEFPNLKISEPQIENYYISFTGEYLGDTEEEAIAKTKTETETETETETGTGTGTETGTRTEPEREEESFNEITSEPLVQEPEIQTELENQTQRQSEDETQQNLETSRN